MSRIAPPPRDLRRRARDAVRAEIAETAFQLFTQPGFDQHTDDDIAAAAAPPPRLPPRPAGEPPWTSLRRALDVLVTTYLGDPKVALARFRLIHHTPALRTTRSEEDTSELQS